ncbi:MAG: hypothetical protein QOD60_1015 [Solirubrobacterales bacterium]|jgi:hypothetical protein|nr:hypothetical protein [Solirubrobacterales bacterium]
MDRRRLALSCGWSLVLSVVLSVAAVEPAPATPVKVRTKQISPPGPFSTSSPCSDAVLPAIAPGFAQETSVAVNPRDPDHVMVSWIQDGRATDTVMASRNGGRSFSRVFVPSLSACTGGSANVASDPGVDFTSNGRMGYFSAITVSFPAGTFPFPATTTMVASRSFDGGFSWEVPSVIQPPTAEFWDLPRLTTHPRRPKTAYYIYDLRKPPDFIDGYSLFSKTVNGGRSWSPPQVVYDPHTSDSWPGISKILVNNDGSLLDVFALVGTTADPFSNPTQEMAVRSVDGGRTWSQPIGIGSSSGRKPNDPNTGKFLNTFASFPSQTVAPNGDVYVAWPELGATNESSQIGVARSTDGGRHWRTRNIPVKGQAALPAIEVAGDGTVGVLHYVIAPSSTNGNWPARVAVATSSDHGRHWKSHRVAGPFNLLTAGNSARPCCFLGDYLGIDRVDNGMVAAFSMAKPVARNQVDAYFTRITTSRAKRRGHADKKKGK